MDETEKVVPPEYNGHDGHDGQLVQTSFIKPQARKLYDAKVTFEEYNYYAEKTREFEKSLTAPNIQILSLLTRKKQNDSSASETNGEVATSKQIDLNMAKLENRLQISDDEWVNASRAFRTAGTGACFYLVSALATPT
jgi:hypothetical protein